MPLLEFGTERCEFVWRHHLGSGPRAFGKAVTAAPNTKHRVEQYRS
jgi:hypothetical protein